MFGSDAFLLARLANGEPEESLAGYDLRDIDGATAIGRAADRGGPSRATGHLE